MPKIRQQDRASSAMKAVASCKDRRGEKLKEYRQELQQLPSMILTSGLGQTLAFYASKGGIHEEIGGQLAVFLTQNHAQKASKTVDLLNLLMTGSAAHYRKITREALAYAEWLKRYSKALIPDSPTEKDHAATRT
jgi:CRISPR-associated protein Cmr5